MLSPVRVRFAYMTSSGPADAVTLAVGHTTHAALDRDRPAVPPSRARPGATCVKALVTGAAGFIGSTLAGQLLTEGRGRRRPRLLRRFLSARVKERNIAGAHGATRFRFVESRIQDADLAAAARQSHARVPPGRASRRAKELGHAIRRLYRQQHRSDAGLA